MEGTTKKETRVLTIDACGQALTMTCSIGHPPHSSGSPVELRLWVGPRAVSGKKKELREQGALKSVCP